MKKNILFAAAIALSMAAIVSCSSKEGQNAANDESVVGATDGLETDTETAEALMNEAPGQLVETTTTDSDITIEDVTAAGKEETGNIVDKAKEVGQTAVDKTKEGYEKAKEAVKTGYDKTTDAVKTGYEKTKDAVKEGIDKAKNL